MKTMHKIDELSDEEIVKKRAKINIKGMILSIAFTLVLSFIISFFTLNKSMKDLEGVWVRQPDDNSLAYGMKVEIKQDGPMYVGEVIAIDDDSTCPIGSIKWNGFQKDGYNVFAQYDLLMSLIESERIYTPSYAVISTDGKMLKLYAPGATSGQNQVWIKE